MRRTTLLRRGALRIGYALVCVALLPLAACGPRDASSTASEAGLDEGDAADCESLENIYSQIECYVARAADTDDPYACKNASNEGVKYQCLAILAERRQERALCDEIPAASPDHERLRDVCISDVAKQVLDAAMCDQVGTAGLRDSCFAAIGRETGNAALCERIEDAGLKSICSGLPVTVE